MTHGQAASATTCQLDNITGITSLRIGVRPASGGGRRHISSTQRLTHQLCTGLRSAVRVIEDCALDPPPAWLQPAAVVADVDLDIYIAKHRLITTQYDDELRRQAEGSR